MMAELGIDVPDESQWADEFQHGGFRGGHDMTPELWTRCPKAHVLWHVDDFGGGPHDVYSCDCHGFTMDGLVRVPSLRDALPGGFDWAVEQMVESDLSEVARLRQAIGASVMTDAAEIDEWKIQTREWMGRRLLAALGEDT